MYDATMDRRIPVLMAAARMLGGKVATWSTPPPHWAQRQRWIQALDAWVTRLHAGLLASSVCHMMASSCYMEAAQIGQDTASLGLMGLVMERDAQRAEMMAAFEYAQAIQAQTEWASIGEVLG